MKYLNVKLIVILTIISIQSCIPTYTNELVLKTNSYKFDSSDTLHIKKMLIVGFGNISSKMVADNISSALEKKMQQNGTICHFKFVNITLGKAPLEFDEKEINSYDTYLILKSKDTALINAFQKKYDFFIPVSTNSYVSGSSYGSSFADVFYLKLYNKQKEILYDGKIIFHINPTDNKAYNYIVNCLIGKLKLAKIALW